MASNIVSGNAVPFVTVAGSVALTWSVGSKTNGGVAVLLDHEQTNNARPMTAVSVGGVAFTKIAGTQYGTGSAYAYSELWMCDDTDANSIGANPTLSVTNAGSGVCVGTIVTLTDIDQTFANYAAFIATDGDIQSNTLTLDITGFTTGSLVLGTYCDQYGSVGVNCAVSGGDATTEFTGSDVNFNSANSRGVQFYATAADTSPHFVVQRSTPSGGAYASAIAVGIPDYVAPPSGPTISSTSDDTPTNGSTLTINGTGFQASQGAGGVTAGGVGWTETSWSDTAIQVTVALGDNKYNVNVSLVVTDDDSNASSGHNVQIQPAVGVSYVNLSGTPGTGDNAITAVAALDGTEQLEISNVQGGSIGDVTVNADATFNVASGVTAFDVRANDGTWGAIGTQYINQASAAIRRGLVRDAARSPIRPVAWAVEN